MKRAAALLLSLLAFSATTYDPAKVAPDLAERVAKFKRVEMPFTYEGLTARERRVGDELTAAPPRPSVPTPPAPTSPATPRRSPATSRCRPAARSTPRASPATTSRPTSR